MLAALTTVKDSAGYVAIARASGKLQGRRGIFLLQHTGTMTGEAQNLMVTVRIRVRPCRISLTDSCRFNPSLNPSGFHADVSGDDLKRWSPSRRDQNQRTLFEAYQLPTDSSDEATFSRVIHFMVQSAFI